jgi:NADH-quinone oxidoreductase subunit M
VVNKIWAAFAATGIVLGAAYMLWLYQRTMFGTVDNPKNEALPDLNLREWATFIPLLILAVWIGLYPKPFIDRLDSSVVRVMTRVNSAGVPLNAGAAGEAAQSPVVSSDLLTLDGDTGDVIELPVRGGAR